MKNKQPAFAKRKRRAGCRMTLVETGVTGSRTMRARRGLPIITVAFISLYHLSRNHQSCNHLCGIGDIVAVQIWVEETANFVA